MPHQCKDFNACSRSSLREIILDIETTGLRHDEGHRIVDIAALEMVGKKLTGKVFHSQVNPERAVPEAVTKIHGLTTEMLRDQPVFAQIAEQLRAFIGDSAVVITCRTHDGYTLDEAFVNAELRTAGQKEVTPWVNVRRWSEEMFGNDKARLDAVLDHYAVDRSDRDVNGHGALRDAQLLAAVYPKLAQDYKTFLGHRPCLCTGKKPKPPAASA